MNHLPMSPYRLRVAVLWIVVGCLIMTTLEAVAVDVPSFQLADGNSMPNIGLGVYRADPGQETYQAVRWALNVGYRLIDTAAMYGNEEDVGRAVKDSGLPRSDIFITTKLDTDSHGYATALQAAEECLRKLGTSYIDLLLIHSPYGGRIVETWDALVQLQEDGKVKSIGVSNFGVWHLHALLKHNRPAPAVNQIELHPLNYQERENLIEYCNKHGIVITAYGSLFSGYQDRFQEGILPELTEKYHKTVPQILLRWALQQGVAVIPKSASSRQRQEENFDILDFEMTQEELEQLNEMDGNALDEYWDPVNNAEVDIGDLAHGKASRSKEL